jgi:hypothetical protein
VVSCLAVACMNIHMFHGRSTYVTLDYKIMLTLAALVSCYQVVCILMYCFVTFYVTFNYKCDDILDNTFVALILRVCLKHFSSLITFYNTLSLTLKNIQIIGILYYTHFSLG